VALREQFAPTLAPPYWPMARTTPAAAPRAIPPSSCSACWHAALPNACLGPLWDPQAVRVAFEAGVGACLALRVGGKVSPLSGAPVNAGARVLALRPEMMMTGLGGTPMALGDCALVRLGTHEAGVDVVLTSARNQAMDTDLFTQLGGDLASKHIIVVKSSQHFYASFSRLTQRVIYVDAPGSVTADLNSLPYQRITRPKWPLKG
jgi:microcystin degradation protein MlrC